MVDNYFCVKCGESGFSYSSEVIVGHKCKGPAPTAANLTLRDYFAGQASEHDLVYYVRLNPAISPAEARWMFADDMLKAREVK